MNKKLTVTPATLVRVNKNFNVDIKRILWKVNYWLINARHVVEMLITFELFKKIANWQVLFMDYLGLLKQGQGIIKLRSGQVISIRLGTADKWTIHEIIQRDDYRIKEIIHECKVVIDLGANAGVFSIAAALQDKGLKVYAYEPDTINFRHLVNNIKINRFSSQILAFPVACAIETGARQLYSSPDNSGHSLVRKGKKKSRQVQVQSLKDIFRKNNIKTCDLLKLDIEGAEYEILYSLDSVTLRKIKYITLEYHNLDKKGKENGRFLQKYLVDQGFDVERKESIQRRVGYIYAINTRKKS